MIHARAPERADLAGGTLDIPPVAIPMKGVTLNTSMREYAYCTLEKRKKKGITIKSLDLGKETSFDDWRSIVYNGQLDLLKAAVKVCKLKGNWNIYTSNDSPKQSGRGSSSAILVALIGAIRKAQGKKLNRREIAELGCDVEIKEMGFRGNGKQDEYGADYPGVKLLRYSGTMDNIKVDVKVLKIPDSFVKEVERDMIIGYIGTRKISSEVNLTMVNNFVQGKKKVVTAFKNLKKITLDMAKAMEKGDVDKFVYLLGEETKNRANLADGIVNDKMKKLIALGKKNGVRAVKVLGAGAGGSMLFYCKHDKREQVVRTLEKAGVKVDRFRFDFDGIQVWKS